MNLSLRQKILCILLGLTCVVIGLTSGVYYRLILDDIRQLSRKQITSAFEMLFDEFESRTQQTLPRIETFIEDSLVTPLNFLYRSQRFYTDERFGEVKEVWDENDVQVWIYISGYLSRLKTVMSKLYDLTPTFHVREWIIYDRQGLAFIVYRRYADREILGLHISRLRGGTFIPLLTREDVQAAKGWTSARDIPLQTLPEDIPQSFTENIPETPLAAMSRVGGHVTLKFTTPIFRSNKLQGICVVHADVLQSEAERYSRFSQTSINVFAETALSVGVLPEYAATDTASSEPVHHLDLLQPQTLLPIQFSRAMIGNQEYYQGRLIFRDRQGQTGVITANVARQLETAKVKELFTLVAIVSLILLLFATFVSLLLSYWISRPITAMTHLLSRLTEGDLACMRDHNSLLKPSAARKTDDRRLRDEIRILSASFHAMVTYLCDMAEIAAAIARGQISHRITPRSDRDVLGHAFTGMVTYLHNVAGVAAAIARGDLTVELALQSEADVFGQSIHAMTTGLRSLIEQIHASTEQITSTSKTIASLTERDMTVVQEAQQSAADMVATMTEMQSSVEEVARNMAHLTSSVGTTSTSMLEMTEEMNGIAINTRELAEQTEHVIADLDRVVKRLETVTNQTNDSQQLSQATRQDAQAGQQAVEHVRASIDVIQSTNAETVEMITSLTRRSEEIGIILDVIYDVTEQSSLLALNASIIAAQSGVHGRGFSVIAGEMRNLANEVKASAQHISEIVHMLQHDIHTVVQKIHENTTKVAQGVSRTQQAQECLQKILENAQQSSEMVEKIANALDIQLTASQTVKTIMEQVSLMTTDVTGAADTQRQTTIQVQTAVEQISQLAAHTYQAAQQQLEGVRLVLKSADIVKSLTDRNLESSQHIHHAMSVELADQADLLLQAVERFQLSSQKPPVEKQEHEYF